MRATSVHLSEQGPARKLNADSVLADNGQGFYAIADGVGSLPASAQASAFAVAEAHRLFITSQANDEAVDLVTLVLRVADRFREKFAGVTNMPSTTLTIAVIRDDALHYVSVGDSPAFLLCDDDVRLLTRAHTAVDRDRIISDFSALKAMGGSNILFNTVGPWPPRPIEYAPIRWEGQSRLILCTDGLLEILSQSELRMLANGPLKGTVSQIRERSLRVAAPDNYSAVIVALPDGVGAR